ncbi:maleylpyruvate isomerase family mycothiol-dependent enzyme [Sphaerisporangium sp. B11E5]|uniref:maleylpyruvate isomerase family mycothiol-dependent enzyme n=1 Tax=Sphaerisporangium sp. B11E5 TaxID=3153563 RepID=UPI00325C7E4F
MAPDEPPGPGTPSGPGPERVTRLALDAFAETAAEPPAGARERLLAAARGRRRPAVTEGFAVSYAARVAAMDALLAGATPADWAERIVEGWTLQELVAHLAATDGLVAAAMGVPVTGPPIAADEVLSRTADVIAYQRDRDPQETRADWRAQAEAICARAVTMDATVPVGPGGISLPVGDHLLARMLETWIHTDDAATVLGVPLPRPLPAHIHPTADFCARLVPWTMALSGMTPGAKALRLRLTGPGGGTWHVPLDLSAVAMPHEGQPSDVSITCDTVAFCFLLGGRGAPATFPADVTGDAALAADVLTAAPALSGP